MMGTTSLAKVRAELRKAYGKRAASLLKVARSRSPKKSKNANGTQKEAGAELSRLIAELEQLVRRARRTVKSS